MSNQDSFQKGNSLTIKELEKIYDPKSMLPVDSDERRTTLAILNQAAGNNGILMRLIDGLILSKASEIINKPTGLNGLDGAIESYYKTASMNSLIELKEIIEKLFEKEEEEEEGVK